MLYLPLIRRVVMLVGDFAHRVGTLFTWAKTPGLGQRVVIFFKQNRGIWAFTRWVGGLGGNRTQGPLATVVVSAGVL